MLVPHRGLFLGGGQFRQDGQIFEGGGVAFDFGTAGDLFEQAAHDLAGTGFGQAVGEADIVGLGHGPDFLADMSAQFIAEAGGSFGTGF